MVIIHLYWSQHCPYCASFIELLNSADLKYHPISVDVPGYPNPGWVVESVPTIVLYEPGDPEDPDNDGQQFIGGPRFIGLLSGTEAFDYIHDYVQRRVPNDIVPCGANLPQG